MSGIYRELLDIEGVIDLEAWNEAVAGYRMVGTCAECRKPLQPESPRRVRRITWFTAYCTGCAREFVSPNGRLRAPARHTS